MPLHIGTLNKRITFQYPTSARDAQGGFVTTYVDAATVWAAIWPMKANEDAEGMKVTGRITHRIRIRYRSPIWPSWRIRFGTRYFNIDGPPINPNERNEYLDIMCQEARG